MINLSSAHTSPESPALRDPVMLISKDPDTRFIFKILLGLLGYACLETENVSEFAQTPDGAGPRLILMDISFPVEEDIRSLSESNGKTHFGEVPIVLISNYPNSDFRNLKESFNVCDHLVKPVSFTLLESCLKKHIRPRIAQSHRTRAM